MSWVNIGLPWTLPPVSRTTSTRPAPSVRACTLVVNPPRDRPIAWSAGSPISGSGQELLSFDGAPRALPGRRALLRVIGRDGGRVAAAPPRARPVLMAPHHCGIDRDQPVKLPGRVGVGLGAGQQLRPRAIGAPPAQPLVGGLPRAEPLGQLTPRRTGPVLPGDRLDHLPVIAPPATPPARRGRQQRLHPRPRRIRHHSPIVQHGRQPADPHGQDPSDTPYMYDNVGPELEGSTVGLVGYGAIGSRVARMLDGFGAEVVVFDPYVTPEALGTS